MVDRNKTNKESDQTAAQQAKPIKNKIAAVFEKTKNKAEGCLVDLDNFLAWESTQVEDEDDEKADHYESLQCSEHRC